MRADKSSRLIFFFAILRSVPRESGVQGCLSLSIVVHGSARGSKPAAETGDSCGELAGDAGDAGRSRYGFREGQLTDFGCDARHGCWVMRAPRLAVLSRGSQV